MIRPCYIVTGGGRTGSHWLEQVVTYVSGYQDRGRPDHHTFTQSVWHTNLFEDLFLIPETVRRTCGLIMIKRQNLFDQAISLVVARAIDEWYEYSNRAIESFTVDPYQFETVIKGCDNWNHQFDRNIRGLYGCVIDFEYEDLVRERDRVEDFVAGKLGFAQGQGTGQWSSNQNPRDYSQLITNYDDLLLSYQKNLGK